MSEKNIAVQAEGIKKQYRLGVIGGGTLKGDLQSWWARKRGKEDPNVKIGSKVYKKNEKFMALDGIDLTIREGERLGIIGHNGAGKSTLLKLLSRVTAPTEGVIRVNGRISSMLEVGTGFNPELTGRENIYLNGAILGMTRAEVSKKIDDIIEFSECSNFIDTPVKRYSSGMYVKLAFAVAAHLDSEIMIMDEVLAVGDMAFQNKCLEKMRDVSMTEGRTILYVSHNMNTIRSLCDRCIVLSEGKIIYDGDVDKAINIYLSKGSDKELIRNHYEFNNTYRHLEWNHGDLRIEELNLDNSGIVCGNKIPLKIKVKSQESTEDVSFRFEFSPMTTPKKSATMTTGKKVSFGENETKELTLELDTTHLVPSRYQVDVVAFTTDDVGNDCQLEGVFPGFIFDLSENPEKDPLLWKIYNWGAVHLQDVELKEE